MRPIKLNDTLIDQMILELKTKLLDDVVLEKDNLECKIALQGNLAPEDKLTIIYNADAYIKQQTLVKDCNDEVGWHGIVQRIDAKTFLIEDIIVFPQIVTGSSVLPDETEYANWLMQYIMDDTTDTFERIRYHGHSHVNMGVFASGVDTKYQRDMLDKIEDYYIFSINNKKGDRLLIVYDITNNVRYDNPDINVKIILNTGELIADWAATELTKVVKPQTHTTTPNNKGEAKNKKNKHTLREQLLIAGVNFTKETHSNETVTYRTADGKEVQI